VDLPELVRVQLVDQLLDGLADQRLEASVCTRVYLSSARKKRISVVGITRSVVPTLACTSAGTARFALPRRCAPRARPAGRSWGRASARAARAGARTRPPRARDPRASAGSRRHPARRRSRRTRRRRDEDHVGLARQRPGRLDAVHLRHADVEEDDVGAAARTRATASRPLAASPTISSSGHASRRRAATCSRIRRSSSAMTAVGLRASSCGHPDGQPDGAATS